MESVFIDVILLGLFGLLLCIAPSCPGFSVLCHFPAAAAEIMIAWKAVESSSCNPKIDSAFSSFPRGPPKTRRVCIFGSTSSIFVISQSGKAIWPEVARRYRLSSSPLIHFVGHMITIINYILYLTIMKKRKETQHLPALLVPATSSPPSPSRIRPAQLQLAPASKLGKQTASANRGRCRWSPGMIRLWRCPCEILRVRGSWIKRDRPPRRRGGRR